MGNKNRPWKEEKKLSKKDKKELEHKEIKNLIKEEKYKTLGYSKNKEKYED
jgi:hypothetical protein